MRASLYCVSEDRALRTAAGTVARRRDAQLRVFAAPEPFFAHVASEADSKRAACLVTEGDTLAAREAAFASRLRQAAGGMPVVIVSGMADLRTVLATLGPGGWSVLASDAGVDALDEAVGRALAFDRWQRDRIGAAERHARATRLGDALRQASTVELTVQLIHELSQPLTAINAWAGACRASVAAAGEAAAALAEPVGLMVQESQRATDILRAFRALARRPEPDLATCDVNAALGGIAALLETEVRAEAIDLRLVLARNLSPARADPTLVELAAYVLCRNAV